jgi:hypothetical protein
MFLLFRPSPPTSEDTFKVINSFCKEEGLKLESVLLVPAVFKACRYFVGSIQEVSKFYFLFSPLRENIIAKRVFF